jgi:hypothetical protein
MKLAASATPAEAVIERRLHQTVGAVAVEDNFLGAAPGQNGADAENKDKRPYSTGPESMPPAAG